MEAGSGHLAVQPLLVYDPEVLGFLTGMEQIRAILLHDRAVELRDDQS